MYDGVLYQYVCMGVLLILKNGENRQEKISTGLILILHTVMILQTVMILHTVIILHTVMILHTAMILHTVMILHVVMR